MTKAKQRGTFAYQPSLQAQQFWHSHLMGFFYRTIRMVENGIKPVYVFDGKPPELKSGVVSNSKLYFLFGDVLTRSCHI